MYSTLASLQRESDTETLVKSLYLKWQLFTFKEGYFKNASSFKIVCYIQWQYKKSNTAVIVTYSTTVV